MRVYSVHFVAVAIHRYTHERYFPGPRGFFVLSSTRVEAERVALYVHLIFSDAKSLSSVSPTILFPTEAYH